MRIDAKHGHETVTLTLPAPAALIPRFMLTQISAPCIENDLVRNSLMQGPLCKRLPDPLTSAAQDCSLQEALVMRTSADGRQGLHRMAQAAAWSGPCSAATACACSQRPSRTYISRASAMCPAHAVAHGRGQPVGAISIRHWGSVRRWVV